MPLQTSIDDKFNFKLILICKKTGLDIYIHWIPVILLKKLT